MSENIRDGKMDIMGVNIDISQVLGDKIVDQFLAQLTEENMKEILTYISSDLFKEDSIYNFETGEKVKKLVIKTRTKTVYSGETVYGNVGANLPESRQYFKSEIEAYHDAIVELIIIL